MSTTEQTIQMAIANVQSIATQATDFVNANNLEPGLTRVIAQRADEVGNAQAAAELAYALIMAGSRKDRPHDVELKPDGFGHNPMQDKASIKAINRFHRRITTV